MKNPLVSVVMPVYNSEKYLRETIESVLGQDFPDFEFVIVEDCPTDGSPAIIGEYAKKDRRIVRVRNRKNLGISESRNRGIGAARGKYIMNMDHDDISMPGRMRMQAEYLKRHPGVGIVGSGVIAIDGGGKTIGRRELPETDAEIRKALPLYAPFSHPSTMVRASAYATTGGYDREFEPADDYELYFRIGRKFKFANIGKPLLKHRLHEGATTVKKIRKMIFKTLDVKRKWVKEYGGVNAGVAFAALKQTAPAILPLFITGKLLKAYYRLPP
ncbi:MAG: glycosyltransferase [Candidatus Micrarchaeia archaeon]